MKNLIKNFSALTAWRLGGASVRRAAMTLLAVMFTTMTAWAGYGWSDGAMTIGGVNTDCTAWSTDYNNPTDIGYVTDMTITSIAFKVSSDASNRSGADMYFRIWDGGSSQVGADQHIWLGAATYIENTKYDYSISWFGTENLASAVGLTLVPGKTYYVDMWAKTYVEGQSGDEWYSGGGANFHAKLTYAPSCGDGVTWALDNGVLNIRKTGSGTGAMADYAYASDQPWYNNRNDITTILINEGVTSIGNWAFSNCEYVTSGVSIPASVKSIGNNAFDACSKLSTVTLNSNPSIGESAFGSAAVTMNVTANSAAGAKWMTFYNQNYSFVADDKTEVFKVALSGTELTMNKVVSRIVDAGTAVVLKSTGDNPVMTLTTSPSGDEQANSLQGATTEITTTGTETYYVLNYTAANGVGFYKLGSGRTIGANKAYLTTTTGTRDFFSFGETTGLKAIDNGQLTIDNSVYDLQGRRVSQPTKGLYIVNGKKVVIK